MLVEGDYVGVARVEHSGKKRRVSQMLRRDFLDKQSLQSCVYTCIIRFRGLKPDVESQRE